MHDERIIVVNPLKIAATQARISLAVLWRAVKGGQ